MSHDVLARLNDATLVALRVRGDDWPRSLLGAAALIPDAWMALVAARDGRRWLTPAGEAPRCGADDALLLVRNRALTIPLQVQETPAACGESVTLSGELLLRWTPREDDLSACLRLLDNATSLSLDGLSGLIASAGLQSALQQFVRAGRAEALVTVEQREPLCAHLRGALANWLFDAGLTLERIGALELRSAGLSARRRLQAETAARVAELQARELVEHAARAATVRRVEGLSGILRKLRDAASEVGEASWRSVLPALTPIERGRLLESLWRITPDQMGARAVVCVCGGECVWLDPHSAAITQRLTLPDDLGGLRSISAHAGGLLLVGAAKGVFLVDAASATLLDRCGVPQAGNPSTAFNAATLRGDWLVATHSELGCWAWRLNRSGPRVVSLASEPPRALLRPSNGRPRRIRAVCALQEGFALAADAQVQFFDAALQPAGTLPPVDAEIHALAVAGQRVFVGTARGLVLQFRRDVPDDNWFVLYRRNQPIESLAVRQWNDLTELVVPGGSEGAVAVYGDEGLTARLMSAASPLRRVWASDDLLVGLSELRDRLYLLTADAAAHAPREAPLARLTGRVIEDACVLLERLPAAEPDSGALPRTSAGAIALPARS